jgi:hypothetical protein
MTGRYAKTTDVGVDRSRAEIEAVLRKYGADAFGYTVDGAKATIGFRLKERYFRFNLSLPDPKRADFHTYQQGSKTWRRADGVPEKMWEQECRSLWRALLLVIKAKLEAVAVGITTLEDEFMAAMVLPNAETVGEWMKPQLEEAYRIGAMPKHLMLEGPRHGS